ncbi:PhoX family protein [Rhodobacter calidifons]|uniref:DUF839 domain-containing protein n=1 Tax=Rhodobacter calidifons TaxID=2715277 RepID=A0ABX0GBX7_9RHOB|nr:alkaline phosphatase PhoX [Rhodobacter calidifons]NHB78427.1 DUF839 domain-containing protein [Rhodobacter calidifons]
MSRYEHDYPDYRSTPFHEHGDEVPSNHSANPTMYDVIDARTSRRGFLVGGLAALATGLFGSGLTPRAALAQTTAASGLLGFKPVPLSKEDTVVVPEGYKVQILAPWGTPLTADAPDYTPGAMTGAAQAVQVGSHHDGMHFFPIDGSSTDGILVLNHEYIEPRFLHAVKWAGQAIDGDSVVFDANGMRDDDEVLAEINAHGCTVARITRGADGQWSVVKGDPMNRRITGLTEMTISGPAAGSAHLVTKFSPDGTRTRGTLNNCAHGVTPWNTYLTAEENWAGYFVNADAEMPREHKRYGVPDKASRYSWEKAASGADEYIRFNAAATGASAAEDYRNEPNTFGWMVEFDPFDPASVPVKRTHLGRFAHEGVVFAPAVAGNDHAATGFAWDLFVIAGTPRQSLTFKGEKLGDDSTFACPDGIWCDPNSRLWIQTDMGDIGPDQKGPLEPLGVNMMLAADPATGEIRRFLTGPWGQEITGVITTPDGATMFVNVQHPGGHASAEQFAAKDYGSGFPDYNGTPPRSATLVITREDGGVIGA